MSVKIDFKGELFTEAGMADIAMDQLLILRNDVAEALGVAAVKGFKDQAAAQTQTWKALLRHAENSEQPVKEKPAKKAKAPPKERGLAKSAAVKTVKRPTKKMFSTITKTGEHDGTQGRSHRWPNYKDGMTIVDVMETEGTEPWDVYNWQSAKIMSVTEPTEDEFIARKAAWYKKHGLTDPDEKKRLDAEARAVAKTEREEKAVEKKAAADAKAAEKKAAK
jgi:hypothetical protein